MIDSQSMQAEQKTSPASYTSVIDKNSFTNRTTQNASLPSYSPARNDGFARAALEKDSPTGTRTAGLASRQPSCVKSTFSQLPAARMSNARQAQHPISPAFTARWSPRAFDGRPLTQEQLRSLFEAARWTPSAVNFQPWRFCYALAGTPLFEDFVGLLVESNQDWARHAGAARWEEGSVGKGGRCRGRG